MDKEKELQTDDKRVQEIKDSNKQEHVEEAYNTAEADIAGDPEMQTDDPEADLDEGELARLDNSNDDNKI